MNENSEINHQEISSRIKKNRRLHFYMATSNYIMVLLLNISFFLSIDTFIGILIFSSIIYIPHVFFLRRNQIYYQYFSFGMIFLGFYYFLWGLGLIYIFFEIIIIRLIFLIVLIVFVLVDGLLLFYAAFRSGAIMGLLEPQGSRTVRKDYYLKKRMGYFNSRAYRDELEFEKLDRKKLGKLGLELRPIEPRYAGLAVISITILIIIFIIFVPNVYFSLFDFGVDTIPDSIYLFLILSIL